MSSERKEPSLGELLILGLILALLYSWSERLANRASKAEIARQLYIKEKMESYATNDVELQEALQVLRWLKKQGGANLE